LFVDLDGPHNLIGELLSLIMEMFIHQGIPTTGLLLMDYQPINYQPNDNFWQTLKLFDRVDGTGIK